MIEKFLDLSLHCVGFDRLLVLELEWFVVVILLFALGYEWGYRKGGKRI